MTSTTDLDLSALGILLARIRDQGGNESAYPCAGVRVSLVGAELRIRTTHGKEVDDLVGRPTFDLSDVAEEDRVGAARDWLGREVVAFATAVRDAKTELAQQAAREQAAHAASEREDARSLWKT